MLELATNLSPELVEEIILLSDNDRATGNAVLQATADNYEMGITLLDGVRPVKDVVALAPGVWFP